MHFGLLLSAVLFLLVSIFPIQALRIFTTDSAILEQGAQYLSIIRFTYLFFAITQILLATLRSVEIRRHCVPAFLYGTTCQLFD